MCVSLPLSLNQTIKYVVGILAQATAQYLALNGDLSDIMDIINYIEPTIKGAMYLWLAAREFVGDGTGVEYLL